METASSNSNSPSFFQISGLFDFLFCHRINLGANSLTKSLSRFWSSYQFQHDMTADSRTEVEKTKNQIPGVSRQRSMSSKKNKTEADDVTMCREDMEIVMKELGLCPCVSGSDDDEIKIEDRLESNEVMKIFEEKEPTLEEIKESFYVFDENRDGFIDAEELQRVLCVLGFREGKELDNCKKMIRAYDQNEDGRIDFQEFAKFMENCIC